MTWSRSLALSTTLAALALNVASAADEYQWEVSLAGTHAKEDTSPETTTTTLLAHGEYHLAPVKLGDHPWEEAAFLEHSTFAEAGLGYLKVKSDPVSATGPIIGVGFTYATPEFPLRLSARFVHSQAKDSDADVDVKANEIDLEAGYWIMPDLLAGLRFAHTKTDDGSTDDKELDFAAFAKWVHGLNPDLAFNAEAELGRNSYDVGGSKDANLVIDVAGDLYFRQRYGVGLSLGTESGDADAEEGLTVGIRASAWFTPQVGVRVGYERFTAKDDATGADDDTVSLEVAGRF